MTRGANESRARARDRRDSLAWNDTTRVSIIHYAVYVNFLPHVVVRSVAALLLLHLLSQMGGRWPTSCYNCLIVRSLRVVASKVIKRKFT